MAAPTPSPSPIVSPQGLRDTEPPALWIHIVGVYDHHGDAHVQLIRIAMIVMACVVGMVSFLCTMLMILRRYYSRRHNHNNNHNNRNTPILFDVNGDPTVVSDDEGPVIDHPIWFIRAEGLQQSLIDSITVFKYRKEEGVTDGTECSVCLGEFQQEESLRLLPKCSHAFHIPCIDTWLRSHKNCPLCRAPVVHDHDGADANANGNGSGTSAEVRATEADSNVSGQNQEAEVENFDGGAATHHLRESEIGEDDDGSDGGESEIQDKILFLPNCDKVNSHASIVIGSQEMEEGIQPMRRSVSMDSSSALMIFRDMVDLNCDAQGSDTHLDEKLNSSSKGSGSTTIYKLASIGRALQKRPISFRGSFSHSRRFLFSRHCRSQSSTASTLPL